eukprot:CAMPEP_0119480348 /NCGR_PEP_ID=MMETSP1344-20130328/9199_1 /TAXON_ID=236787 /ORGANISM="Florenciella parvula, Strain CCMP2471" /LENGTH=91 /DNA_ID=CAMNT_0007514649 /DNA_START=105 /DNA_END=376 /DNA_ORIENTATION=+
MDRPCRWCGLNEQEDEELCISCLESSHGSGGGGGSGSGSGSGSGNSGDAFEAELSHKSESDLEEVLKMLKIEELEHMIELTTATDVRIGGG